VRGFSSGVRCIMKVMNIPEVIEELKKKYPGKKILMNHKKNVTEILCETDPTSAHASHSTVISVIDKTDLHFHEKSTETYSVIKGTLTLRIDGETVVLAAGESQVILPHQKHEAMGDATWVKCTSKPGWRRLDHHLVA